MSHTKQAPILNYSTADLPVGDPAGTVVFNTDKNCLNYYNGTTWVTSDDWESTYTTVSSNSAIWNQAGNYDHTLIETTSGDWDSTYTTVSSNSAIWGAGITEVFEDKTPELGGNLQVTGGRTIIDQYGNELVKFEVQNSAGTSYIGIRNGNVGGPSLKALGDDVNLDLNLQPKGTGSVKITASGGLNLNGYNIKSLGSNILKPIANGNDSYISITAWSSTTNPEIGVVSVNTNQGLTLKAKGTGNIKLGTLEFDTDQSVSSSNNDHVLSYSSTDGFISLKPVPGFNNTTVTTASYTQIAGTSHFLYDDSTAGQAITVTVLPVESHNGETTHMKIGSTATVILSSNTTATINGAQSYTLNTTYEAVKMFTDGVNYFVY